MPSMRAELLGPGASGNNLAIVLSTWIDFRFSMRDVNGGRRVDLDLWIPGVAGARSSASDGNSTLTGTPIKLRLGPHGDVTATADTQFRLDKLGIYSFPSPEPVGGYHR